MKRAVTLGELGEVAEEFAHALVPREDGATVVALYGDLGAGKTTFVQHLAKALGVAEPVTSPTFVIQKIYPLERQRFSRLVHVDAYRLEDEHELAVLGWSRLLQDSTALVVVEWANLIPNMLPEEVRSIWLAWQDENTRTIEYGKED